jgi:hypothetical protein
MISRRPTSIATIANSVSTRFIGFSIPELFLTEDYGQSGVQTRIQGGVPNFFRASYVLMFPLEKLHAICGVTIHTT